MKFIEVLADGADAGVAEDRRHTETVALLTDSRDSRHAMRDKKRDATSSGYAVGSRAFDGCLFSLERRQGAAAIEASRRCRGSLSAGRAPETDRTRIDMSAGRKIMSWLREVAASFGDVLTAALRRGCDPTQI